MADTNSSLDDRRTQLSLSVMARQIHSSISSRLRYRVLPPVLTTSTHIRPQAFTLPLPQDIATTLSNAGCPQDAANQMSKLYVTRANRLRVHWEAEYHKASKIWVSRTATNTIAQQSLDKLGGVIQRHYERLLDGIFKEALDRACALGRQRGQTPEQDLEQEQQPVSHIRHPFNQEFVPLLEEYFACNAYPSASHRNFLAQKSNMSPRQIAVWFQNHRNRAKKEGIKLIKNPAIRLHIVFSKQDSCSPAASDTSDVELQSSDEEDADDSSDELPVQHQSQHLESSFVQTTPIHAFPTPYPPVNCGYAPFPIKAGERAFVTPWYRTPSLCPHARLKKVKESEIEGLCTDFMTQAHVRAPDKPHKRRRRRWDTHLCTIPYSAPLPALISTPIDPVLSRPTKKLPNLRRAPASWRQVFITPDNSSVSPVPFQAASSETSEGTGRWITQLSGRPPTRPRPLSRASTPSTPSTLGSSPSSPTEYSRRRPLESDSSSSSLFSSPSPKRRRTSSSSESSSSLASTITTPKTSSTNLPTAIVAPTTSGQGPDFNFSSLDELFGDFPPAPPLTAAELFQFGFQPPTISTNKDSFNISAFLSQPQPPVFATS